MWGSLVQLRGDNLRLGETLPLWASGWRPQKRDSGGPGCDMMSCLGKRRQTVAWVWISTLWLVGCTSHMTATNGIEYHSRVFWKSRQFSADTANFILPFCSPLGPTLTLKLSFSFSSCLPSSHLLSITRTRGWVFVDFQPFH